MVTKVNISLPKDVLDQLDRAARELRTSRSGLLVRAIKHFLEEQEEEKKRERRRKAVETIIKIADEIGPWDGTAEVLKWRQKH